MSTSFKSSSILSSHIPCSFKMRAFQSLAILTSAVSALTGPLRSRDLVERQSSSKYPAHIFNQLVGKKIGRQNHLLIMLPKIDHFPDSDRYSPHTNATFSQQYFFDTTYYKPGGPVYLYIGGETRGQSRFSNLETGIIQILSKATGGLGVILENRYYGKSYPFENSTTDNLRFLTTEQTVADIAYFAQNVVFPGINSTLTAPNTPWILYGGSLAGSQTAFALHEYGTDSQTPLLWAGIAASGTTKAKITYPEWYDPIQKYGPQDAIGSLNAIIDKIDKIFSTQNRTLITQMKSYFGLEELEDDRDFAMTIAFPLGGPMNYPTATWQELNWNPAVSSNDFWYFMNNITNNAASENITALDTALSSYTDGESWTNFGNYANYIKSYLLPICNGSPINSISCFGTQNQTYYQDPTNSGGRSYLYSTCTESGLYQVATNHGPSLISRVLQQDYTQQWCTWAFPPGRYNTIPLIPDIDQINKYGGYNVIAPRLAHIDGSSDVWTPLTYHSSSAGPRLTINSTDSYLHPQLLINGAGHHWDSNSLGYDLIDQEPDFIRQAHLWQIHIVQAWLKEFDQKNGIHI